MKNLRGYAMIAGAAFFWGISATAAKFLFNREVSTLLVGLLTKHKTFKTDVTAATDHVTDILPFYQDFKNAADLKA
jgi:hypothetical protein